MSKYDWKEVETQLVDDIINDMAGCQVHRPASFDIYSQFTHSVIERRSIVGSRSSRGTWMYTFNTPTEANTEDFNVLSMGRLHTVYLSDESVSKLRTAIDWMKL